MITIFFRHGMGADHGSMEKLSAMLKGADGVEIGNNCTYKWKEPIVPSGLELASQVVSTEHSGGVLLVGHSQGGLVCRVAAVALTGRPAVGEGGCDEIRQWQCGNGRKWKAGGGLGVVTIGTPNSGALTYGQMSIHVEALARTTVEAVEWLGGVANIRDLMTPRLFQELEQWRVDARYLSVSAVCVNRYSRGVIPDLANLLPFKRVSIRLDVPNDELVEDSSTDLRQSVIRPEVDLEVNYRHVRAYPRAIDLHHSSVRTSPEVAKVILEHLGWLVRRQNEQDQKS